MRGELLLVEEYWLLTTGSQLLPRPPRSVLFGTAMAVVRDLERAGEVTWRGVGAGAVLLVDGPCRCKPPLLAWHDALIDHAGTGVLPASSALDAIVGDAWWLTAEWLIARSLALAYRSRHTPAVYGVLDTAAVRRLRAELVGLLPAGEHLPSRQLDLLLIAHASASLGDLLRAPDTPLPGSVLSFVGGLVRRDHRDFRRYRETVTQRDGRGWAYGSSVRGPGDG